LDTRLEELRSRGNRLIVGIEAGNSTRSISAAIVEVSGRGDDTIIDIYSFKNIELPGELVAALDALDRVDDFDSEEIAGINFLLIHQINGLFQDLFDDIQLEPGDVDLLGIKCMEIAGKRLPEDPSVISEMTGCIVASRFTIGLENGKGPELVIVEPILRKMVGEIMERLEIDMEASESVAVALMANEAVYSDGVAVGNTDSGDRERAGLYGEFYFPA
jgi:hypothetical protein